METRNYMNPPYGQPTLAPPQGQPVPVVLNQQQPVTLPSPEKFGTTPIAMNCIFCKKPITTKVNRTCNICACLLCYLTGLVFYVLVQACRKNSVVMMESILVPTVEKFWEIIMHVNEVKKHLYYNIDFNKYLIINSFLISIK